MLTSKLRRAIRRLINAEIDVSWMGSQHPETWHDIEQELKRAKEALNKLLKELEENERR